MIGDQPPVPGGVPTPEESDPKGLNARKWVLIVGALCIVAVGAVAAVVLTGDDDTSVDAVADKSTTTSEATTTSETTTTSLPPTSADPGFLPAPGIDVDSNSYADPIPYDEGGMVQAVEGTWIVALRSIDAAQPQWAIQEEFDEALRNVPDAELLDANEWASLRDGYLVAYVGPFMDAGSTWDFCNSSGLTECFGAPLTQNPADQSVRIQPGNPRP